MTSPTDVSPPAAETGIAPEQPNNSRPQPSRLNQALAWVGIVAGGLFIVGAVFFSGFLLSWSMSGPEHDQKGPAPMACCADMKPGEQMKPGEMMPGGMMPGGMMGPAPQSPASTPSNTPRP